MPQCVFVRPKYALCTLGKRFSMEGARGQTIIEEYGSDNIIWKSSPSTDRNFLLPDSSYSSETPPNPQSEIAEDIQDPAVTLLEKYQPTHLNSSPLSCKGKAAYKHQIPTPIPPAKRSSKVNLCGNGPLDKESRNVPLAKFALSSNQHTDSYSDDDLLDCRDFWTPLSHHNQKAPQIFVSQRGFIRYLVLEVAKHSKEQLLQCVSTSGLRTDVLLKQSWAASDVRVGDIIHICTSLTGSETERNIAVTDAENFLIVCPDELITCTDIAESINCDRKVILRNRLRGPSDTTKPLVYGNVTHELIQRCLSKKQFFLSKMLDTLAEILRDYTEELILINSTPEHAMTELRESIPQIIKWAGLFYRPSPIAPVNVYCSSKKEKLCIKSVESFEDEIWSVKYGLKGKVDAIVETASSRGTCRCVLEIKTGKNKNVSHYAQSLLYQLLFSDKYGIDPPWTLLYYSCYGETLAVPPIKTQVRALLQKRNVLARYVRDLSKLPSPCVISRNCDFCDWKNLCSVANHSEVFDIEQCSKMSKSDYPSRSITAEQNEFLSRWLNLLVLEDISVEQRTRDIWCRSPAEREEDGYCFADLVVEKQLEDYGPNGIRHNYLYRLRKKTESEQLPTRTAILFHDRVTVSSLQQLRVCQGSVVALTPQCIDIVTDSPLSTDAVYRVDKDTYRDYLAYSRYNLYRLLSDDTKLAKVVIGLEHPKFTNTQYCFPDKNFNVDQKKAITKVLQAKDYALILGMPGTGKTTTITGIVEALVAQGKSVLISAYTHTAVDNIVVKLLKQTQVKVLRLGNADRVRADVHCVTAQIIKATKTPEELEAMYMSAPVVATTALGLSSWLFTRRKFDYCIVDEASQITLPACIGPLLYADKFVLVGDNYQLPPLVVNKAARQGGLDESLFDCLCRAHPEAVTALEHQFRMSKDIMTLSNELVYDGRLKIANETVARQKLDIQIPSETPRWLKQVLDPEHAVVFIDTDSVDAKETAKPDGYMNEKEAELVTQIVDGLCKAGLAMTDIGVITVYRVQLRLLRARLSQFPQVELLTADKAQGRDSECIVISLVRSNSDRQVGELLRDWRRLNVTFTRAKKKLIILGSRGTLEGSKCLKEFLNLVETHQWVYYAEPIA